MKIKYLPTFNPPKIKKIEIVGETERFLLIDGKRVYRSNYWNKYFDTYKEAYDYLIDAAASKIKIAEESLTYANNFMVDVLKLKDCKMSDKKRSCYFCKQQELCYMKQSMEKFIDNATNNINQLPGTSLINVLAGCCLKYEIRENN